MGWMELDFSMVQQQTFWNTAGSKLWLLKCRQMCDRPSSQLSWVSWNVRLDNYVTISSFHNLFGHLFTDHTNIFHNESSLNKYIKTTVL